MVIVATVALYGLTAVPVARRLGVTHQAHARPPCPRPAQPRRDSPFIGAETVTAPLAAGNRT